VLIAKGTVVAEGSLTSMRDTKIELRVNSFQIEKVSAEFVTLAVALRLPDTEELMVGL